MTARDEILASVRRSLHVSGDEAPRRAAVAARLAQAPIGIVPARGQGDAAARIATFKAEAARAAATISEAPSADDVPIEIARWLREGNMPATLRMGADPRLAAMPWAATTIEVSHGPSDGYDLNAVSAAFAAVAETGTLALVSGVENPTTLNFLPENHIAVVFADDVVGDFESRVRPAARRIRRRRPPAHVEFRHRPVAVGRYRADADVRRPRAPATAHRDGGDGLNAPQESRCGDLVTLLWLAFAEATLVWLAFA